MSINWLVTGGCGFIGVNLVKILKKRGDYVRVLDNLSVGDKEDLRAVTEFKVIDETEEPFSSRVELVVGDIRDYPAVRKAMEGVNVVVHLAAQTGVMHSIEDPLADCNQNVIGLLNVLQAAREVSVSKFVFASSNASLGEQDPPLHEQKIPRPLSPYGASKQAGEAYCSAFYASFGINAISLRFSNVYGPFSHKKNSVITLFFQRATSGKPLIVYGDGSQTRDFTHVDDICQAIIKSAEKDVGGEILQIGTGVETSIIELANNIIRLVETDTGKKLEILYQPRRKGEIQRNVSDISKAERMLGYNPRVKLEQGLENTWRNLFKAGE